MNKDLSLINTDFVNNLIKTYYDKTHLSRDSKRHYYRYVNNNYVVSVKFDKLTKRAFRVGEDLISDFPDSIDLKITNKCSNACPYCHENSTPDGKSFNIDKTTEILSQLPLAPIEIAIGGGNILEEPQELANLLLWCYSRGFRTRLTINVNDINTLYLIGYENEGLLEKILTLPDAIGVSINGLTSNALKIGTDTNSYYFGRSILDYNILGDLSNTFYTVYHIIAGVFPYHEVRTLIENTNFPVLVLGYKQWGRAKNHLLPPYIKEFEREIKQAIYRSRDYGSSKSVCFDNLALDQLNIRDSLSPQELEEFYLGDEGCHSMYIDAVEGKFARTSRDSERVDWNSIGLLDFFKSLRQ